MKRNKGLVGGPELLPISGPPGYKYLGSSLLPTTLTVHLAQSLSRQLLFVCCRHVGLIATTPRATAELTTKICTGPVLGSMPVDKYMHYVDGINTAEAVVDSDDAFDLLSQKLAQYRCRSSSSGQIRYLTPQTPSVRYPRPRPDHKESPSGEASRCRTTIANWNFLAYALI